MVLRASLLIHGPPGSGKATAVKAAAAAFGLHIVPYGCAGLHRGDGQSAELLRAAFEAAEGFAPAVLLLTGFDALAGSAAEGASNPGSSLITAILVSSSTSDNVNSIDGIQ